MRNHIFDLLRGHRRDHGYRPSLVGQDIRNFPAHDVLRGILQETYEQFQQKHWLNASGRSNLVRRSTRECRVVVV